MRGRRCAAALECFRAAHALGEDGFLVHFGLGSALLDTGSEADAIPELERAVALDRAHAGALHNLGKARYGMGLVDEAVASFRAALAVSDDVLDRISLATVIPGSPAADGAHVLAARRELAVQDL